MRQKITCETDVENIVNIVEITSIGIHAYNRIYKIHVLAIANEAV